MPNIAVSGWMAYAPFRVAESQLSATGITLVDRAHDRVEGLLNRRYDAVVLSNYEFVEAFTTASVFKEFGVAWAFVEPVGFGSDRIIARRGVHSVEDIHRSRVGLRSSGLEVNLFEHLFAISGLRRKEDYVVLPDRDAYRSAFTSDAIDVAIAPQPLRSQLLAVAPDAYVFEGDVGLPRFGLYAIVVHRRDSWNRAIFLQMRDMVSAWSSKLAVMNDTQLWQTDSRSFAGICNPAAELKATVCWLSTAVNYRYLTSEGDEGFLSHVGRLTEFRSQRFGTPQLSSEDFPKVIDSQLL